MRPTTLRTSLFTGLIVGAGGLVGYLTSDQHPTLGGAAEISAAVLLAVLAVGALAVWLGRQLGGSDGRTHRG